MESIRDIVEFRSSRLSPVLPDDAQVNPGRYGAELAFWLCVELAKRGVVTSYPESEDWGWFIEYITESGSEFAIHCGNIDGTSDQWLLSLRRHAGHRRHQDTPRDRQQRVRSEVAVRRRTS
jgi:hypothetical protein